MVDVLITDERSGGYDLNDAYFAGIDRWAQETLGSKYLGYTVQDVSDVSLQWDEIACYTFEDEATANWFKLRWQS
jgi:hypothetical protein